jgi:uncharacterized damage-inducible protein DinB
MREIVASIEGEYRRYKKLADEAIAQVSDEELSQQIAAGNSIVTIIWHISGNLASRFTDFLTSDGEKPWRDRDDEFARRTVPREALREKWERGWGVVLESLRALDDSKLASSVSIRGVSLSVTEALHRSLAHTSYHVGQIVFLARTLKGEGWRYLTIPPGGSPAYNANPIHEKPKG